MIAKFLKKSYNESEDSESEKGTVSNTFIAIASRYMKSGVFFFDLIATFPFFLFNSMKGGTFLKLVRLIRLPRILRILNTEKV